MILKCMLALCVIGIVWGKKIESDDYLDSLISLLMDGEAVNYEQDIHDVPIRTMMYNRVQYCLNIFRCAGPGYVSGTYVTHDVDPMLIGDLWKCGDCDDIDDSKLIYSEVNNVDNTVEDLPIEIQIGVAAPDMRCVTIKTDLKESIITKIIGACSSGAVTLTVSPPQQFVVNAYS